MHRHDLGLALAAALAIATATGCMSAAGRGFPRPVPPPAERLRELAAYWSAEQFAAYAAAVGRPDERKRLRDEILNARVAAIDVEFNRFLAGLHREGVGLNIGTDAVSIGLAAAGALASGGTSQILSGASAAVQGLKKSIDKNAFFEQTMPALMAQMIAARKSALVTIRRGLALPDAAYPLPHGLSDVETYYYAGTIPGAVSDIVESAGAEAKQAEQKLEKTIAYAPTTTSRSLNEVLTDPATGKYDRDKLAAMRACWPRAGVPDDTLVVDFMLEETFEAQRRAVCRCMGVAGC